MNGNNGSNNNNILKKETEFICRLQFRNTLPEIPFDPKLLAIPLDPTRFVKYNASNTLERNFKHQLWTEVDLGIPITLIDPEVYKKKAGSVLAPEDDTLVRPSEDLLRGGSAGGGKLGRRMETLRPQVPWLKKTTYLSTEDEQPKARSKMDIGGRHSMAEDENLTIEEKSRIVEQMFELASQVPLVHPHKPGVEAIEILPVLPDRELYPQEYVEIIYDADPLDGATGEMNERKRKRAMIKPIENSSFCDLFVPVGKSDVIQEGDIYEQVRAVRADVVNSKEVEFNYCFIERDGVIYYNPLKLRVRPRRLRFEADEHHERPGKIRMVKAEPDETELRRRELRTEKLNPPEVSW